jgi:putative flippase GtrA
MLTVVRYFTKHQVVRYLIGGGSSAAVNLCSLYIMNSLLRVYYITASIIAFAVAFSVSWAFHKFWTFGDHSMEGASKQGALYLLTSLFGLALNTSILFIAVAWINLPVLVGQVAASILVACCTFFIARHFVFRRGSEETEEPEYK